MPVYFYWGDDEFAITRAVQRLRDTVLDPSWAQFNYDKIPSDRAEGTIQALNQAMTPPFGLGERLVWLVDAAIAHQCSEEVLAQLQQTLPAIPSTSHLLLTSPKKPDKRLKVSKLLEKYADVREFSRIALWKTDELVHQVQHFSQEMKVKLTLAATQLLAESVGNDSRQLWNELEKLRLYAIKQTAALDSDIVATLVNANTQNSLQLAEAIRNGDSDRALKLVMDLSNRNEPALRIVATLVGQFRTWAIVKLKMEAGERDEKEIAAAADIANPKRIYFLRKELQAVSSQQLLATLPILLELEWNLKRGSEPVATLQTKAIELCQLFP